MTRNRHGTRIGPNRPADRRSYFTCGDRNHGTAENPNPAYQRKRNDLERTTCSEHRKFFLKLSRLEFDTQLSPSKPCLW